jgi:hypothetical protein
VCVLGEGACKSSEILRRKYLSILEGSSVRFSESTDSYNTRQTQPHSRLAVVHSKAHESGCVRPPMN